MTTTRPIIMDDESVRAILDGRKTQTRRAVKPQPTPIQGGVRPGNVAVHPAPYIDAYRSEAKTPDNPDGMSDAWYWWAEDNRLGPLVGKCPYGKPGDLLWVRETWALEDTSEYGVDAAVAAAPPRGPVKVEDRGPDWGEAMLIPRYRASEPDTLLVMDEAEDGEPIMRWSSPIHMPRWAARLWLRVKDVRVERLQDINDEVLKEGFQGRLGFVRAWDDWNAGRGYPWASNPYVWVVTFQPEYVPARWSTHGGDHRPPRAGVGHGLPGCTCLLTHWIHNRIGPSFGKHRWAIHIADDACPYHGAAREGGA